MENTQKSFIVKSLILGERSFVRVKEKQRKKFHWWYIPLGIVLVLALPGRLFEAFAPCAGKKKGER